MWALGGVSLAVMAVDRPRPKRHGAGHQLEQHKNTSPPCLTPRRRPSTVHLQDLNDGHQDALVLMLGRDYGGTCGRTMFISRRQSFRFARWMTCVQQPVCILIRTPKAGMTSPLESPWYNAGMPTCNPRAGSIR